MADATLLRLCALLNAWPMSYRRLGLRVLIGDFGARRPHAYSSSSCRALLGAMRCRLRWLLAMRPASIIQRVS